MSIFPSGNIIIGNYKSFIINVNDFNYIIQTKYVHDSFIYYVDIYDENILLLVQMIKLLKLGLKWIMNIQLIMHKYIK